MSNVHLEVGVIGAGSWGTALSMLLADKGYGVTLWAHEAEVRESINERHENELFLKGIRLPANIRATGDMEEACRGKDMIVTVTPSHVTRLVMKQAVPYLPEHTPIVSATKGIENDTLMTVNEVLEDVLPLRFHPYLAFLSGPSFAREVAQHHPTAVAVASFSEKLAIQVQRNFNHRWFRVYRSNDVVGMEIGGSLKNVIAIAAGISDGMGFGHNSRAGLITRGLAEMSRMAVARGANPLTLAGLAGMGDLVLTCTGELSRNRAVGIQLGQGKPIAEILGGMNMVAEGVKTARSVHDLAARMKVEMPICEAVFSVLYEAKTPQQALLDLMGRELKRENFGF
jgi:glycerol-3-phosphate dehydrogenase (NAD(P)+)